MFCPPIFLYYSSLLLNKILLLYPKKKKVTNYLTLWPLQSSHQHCDLNFRGINYSADVYLNGHKIALPKGMFRRHTLDVTNILHHDGTNLLAVLVHPPDHPGRIPPEGGQGGDHEVRN